MIITLRYFNMVNSLIVQNMENDLDNKTFVKLQNLGFKTGLKPSSLMVAFLYLDDRNFSANHFKF